MSSPPPPQAQHTHVVATIPAGVAPGSSFTVIAYGRQFTVVAPPGSQPGHAVLVPLELPAAADPPPSQQAGLSGASGSRGLRRRSASPGRTDRQLVPSPNGGGSSQQRGAAPAAAAGSPNGDEVVLHATDIPQLEAGYFTDILMDVLSNSVFRIHPLTLAFKGEKYEDKFRNLEFDRQIVPNLVGQLIFSVLITFYTFQTLKTYSYCISILTYMGVLLRVRTHFLPHSPGRLQFFSYSVLGLTVIGIYIGSQYGPRAAGEVSSFIPKDEEEVVEYGMMAVLSLFLFLLLSFAVWGETALTFWQRILYYVLVLPGFYFAGMPSPRLHPMVAITSALVGTAAGTVVARAFEYNTRQAFVRQEVLHYTMCVWRAVAVEQVG